MGPLPLGLGEGEAYRPDSHPLSPLTHALPRGPEGGGFSLEGRGGLEASDSDPTAL